MKIALLFPGYGNQYVGMGKELYDEYRIVQEYFEEASHCIDINFVKLCFASSDSEISTLINAYASLFLLGTATCAVLKENNIIPDVVVGYNNGEYAALCAASSFSLPDGLYLINKFCSFYQDVVDGMDVDVMRVTGITTQHLSDLCGRVNNDEGKAFIAIYNNSTDHIVAGNRNQLAQIQDAVGESGSIEYCGVEYGLHSELINQVIEQFRIYLAKVDFKDLHIPMLSGLDGSVITNGETVKERFIRTIDSPFRFDLIMNSLHEYDCILVAAPGNKLSEVIKGRYPEKVVISIAKKSDIDTLKEIVAIEQDKTGLIDGN